MQALNYVLDDAFRIAHLQDTSRGVVLTTKRFHRLRSNVVDVGDCTVYRQAHESTTSHSIHRELYLQL